MTAYVYKIDRVDGLSYIGITVNPKNRFKYHEKSDRFKIGISSKEILKECKTYKEAEDLEEYYINLYDTYENGLNLTYNGKGLSESDKFNTLGHVFSVESKRKMSEAKIGNTYSVGRKHSEETKKKYSNLRKGICWKTNLKLDESNIAKIKEEFHIIEFDNEYISKFIKKSQREIINELSFEELKSPNGKSLNKLTLYCNYCSEKYNVTAQYIRKIIEGKHGSIHHSER